MQYRPAGALSSGCAATVFTDWAHEWAARRVTELVSSTGARPRTVVAHLEPGAALCDHHFGLLGLAGLADLRDVLGAEQAGRPNAVLAIEVWLYRLRGSITAMTAALGGLDLLVFSGGVREYTAGLRRPTEDPLGLLRLPVAPRSMPPWCRTPTLTSVPPRRFPDHGGCTAGRKRPSPAWYAPPSVSSRAKPWG